MDRSKLLNSIKEENIKFDEPLKDHTSFKTGGNAKVLITVNNVGELKEAIDAIKEQKLPFFLLGNGSNVLASDSGYEGALIKLGGDFLKIAVEGNKIKAGAAISLSKLANVAMNASLKGLEFASGIPGTLGGALYMNAGAYNGEMSRVVTKVTVLEFGADNAHIGGSLSTDDPSICEKSSEGNVQLKELSNSEMAFGYRRSILKDKGYIALGCEIELEEGDKDSISSYMKELALKRKEKQPLEYPSAGSTFKRPEGYFAGKLIEEAGLGGFCIGDAQVSEKHKGFIINKGNASASDIKRLIDHVSDTVYDNSGVRLEPEVIFLGDF